MRWIRFATLVVFAGIAGSPAVFAGDEPPPAAGAGTQDPLA